MVQDFSAALAQHQSGRLAEAEDAYRGVLAAEPQHVDALRLLGVLRFQRGDAAEAERLLRQVIAISPENAKAYDNLAFVLHAAGRDAEALPALRRAVELAPTNDAFLANLGNLFIEMHRTADAVETLRRAAAVNPGNAAVHEHLGSELLKTGDAGSALRHLDACISLGAANSSVFAHKAIALTELGDTEGLRALVDLDRLVICRDIGDGHGFPSLADFNAELARAVSGSATLHAEVTTVNGLDTTSDLLNSPESCIGALRGFIYSEIERRLRELPGAGHPFAVTAPKRWRTESWGVKMWRQGHQVTHIHQKAWLSGVYYVQLPEIVRPGQKGNDGWIEFGRGPSDLYTVGQPETRLIQPVEGMLITFPSYVWHRTIPFEAARDRISIAFDVIPVA